MDELQELQDYAQESMHAEEDGTKKVSNWNKELESKLFSYQEVKTEMTRLQVLVV